MASFKRACLRTIGNEGGYVNDPDDRGGETKYGISKRSYPEIDIAALTYETAQTIYKRDYWDVLVLDSLGGQYLAEQVFDFGINAGVKTAARCLQDAYNLLSRRNGLKVDGLIGAVTVGAINNFDHPAELLGTYKGLRFAHCLRIVRYNIAQEKYFLGWVRRIGIE